MQSYWQFRIAIQFPHYYGTNTENSELLIHSTFTYFYDSLVIILRRPIKRRSISLPPSSESLAPSSDSFVNPSTCCYLALHSRHFVRHLGICNPICVELLQLMCAVITHNSLEKRSLYINTHNSLKKRSLYINKWLSYGQLQCFPAAILSAILKFVIGFVSNFCN